MSSAPTNLPDSRLSPPVLRARLAAGPDGTQVLLSPGVGLYRGAPGPGALVGAGQPIGALEILGVVHHVLAPAGAGGVIIAADSTARPGLASGNARVFAPARRPVDFTDVLLTLDPAATRGELGAAVGAPAATSASTGAAVFRAPTSGRYYGKSGPGKPAFVSVGAILEPGQTIGLIEVMKTFSRVLYGGDGLPARARVVKLLVTDESDVAQGDPLIEVEPTDQNMEPHPS